LFARIFYAALVAGLIAGLFVTVIQGVRQVPLIHLAETFEQVDAAHGHGHDAASEGAHDHGEGWAPADGLERTAFTALANLLAGVGYALVMIAAFALSGGVAGVRQGVLWGLGGYATFVLAPAFGLPPELPGSVAPDLMLRQAWWILTAAATAIGLLMIVFTGRHWLKGIGALSIALPHAIPLPHPAGHGTAPPELAAQFVTATLVTNLLFWIALGALSAVAFRRIVMKPAPAEVHA